MPDLVAAAETEDRLVALRALRGLLAAQIDVCESSRDVAALSRQFTDVLVQIESLTRGDVKSEEDSTFDELARRRSNSARGKRASGGKSG